MRVPRLVAIVFAVEVFMTACAGGDEAGSGGAAGIAGNAGVTGGAGTTGAAGTAGPTGSAGIGGAGTSGAAGTAGTSGTSGGAGTAAAGGSFGRGGSTGAAGVGGRAGTTGIGGGAGAAGTAGRGGAGGGPGGATGGAGNGGRGGASGGGGQAGLPAGVVALFPPPNGQGICPDPPLRIRFSAAPTLGTSGRIEVFNSAASPVATVDMAASSISDTIGGTTFNRPRTVYVEGNDAVIYLKTKALAYGQTYYVTVDAAAIRPPGGGTLAITDATTWRFSTVAAAPTDLVALTVAVDGTGQFCSVQGALDALPANNSAAARVTINAGRYHEIIHFRAKNNVTLHGQDRKQTIIEGTNNDTQNPGTATRSLVGIDASSGLVIENLTIHNLTPQGGSQAEALRLQSCDRCVVRDADILSLQDTLLWSGRIYAANAYIAGNVDYVWGTGAVYFDKCEIRTVGRSGVLVQSRNGAGAYGYVFVDSKITADGAATSNMLARIDVSVYPGSHVAYVNCQLTNIAPAGWTITGGSPTSSLRFWEYQSTDAAGNPVDVSRRVAGSTQISAAQATMMRDPSVVLGGWSPPR